MAMPSIGSSQRIVEIVRYPDFNHTEIGISICQINMLVSLVFRGDSVG
jgi:hypothetical protein